MWDSARWDSGRWDELPPPLVIVDTHDGGKREQKRLKRFQAEAARREARRLLVMDNFERVVEGKEIPAAVAAEVVQEAVREVRRAQPIDTGDFGARLEAQVQKVYRAYLDRDDEDVLALL